MVLLESIAEAKGCFPRNLLILNIALASINGFLATIAFSQVSFAYPFLCNLYSLCFFSCIRLLMKMGLSSSSSSFWFFFEHQFVEYQNWCACICPDFELIELSNYIEAVLLCLVSEKEEESGRFGILREFALRFVVVKHFPFLSFYLVWVLNGALDYFLPCC
jgi:hypothetical protein